MEKNIADQKWYIKAWDETDNTVKTGDAANITANLRLDGGAANAIDDVNPTELEDGYYVFDVTQAESNADYILICPSSTTANIQVEGCPKAFTTTAPNLNKLGIESDGDLTKVNLVEKNTDMRGTNNAAPGSVWNVDKAEEIEDIKTITDQISFDASGNVNTSISRPAGKVVVDASNSASSFVTDLAQTADDYWLNAWVKFTSGNLINQVRKVQGYNGITKVLSFYSPYTETPAAGDDFELIVE